MEHYVLIYKIRFVTGHSTTTKTALFEVNKLSNNLCIIATPETNEPK